MKADKSEKPLTFETILRTELQLWERSPLSFMPYACFIEKDINFLKVKVCRAMRGWGGGFGLTLTYLKQQQDRKD